MSFVSPIVEAKGSCGSGGQSNVVQFSPRGKEPDKSPQKFALTFGSSITAKVFQQKNLTLEELIALFSEHRESPRKDGLGFVCGPLLGGQRKAAAVPEISVIAIDVDALGDLDELEQRLDASGVLVIVHTTHNHLSTTTEVPTDGYARWAAKAGQPQEATTESLLAYLATIGRDYLREIAFDGERHHGPDGLVYRVGHAPLNKIRLLYPLMKPIIMKDLGGSTSACKEEFRSILAGVAAKYELPFDTSCVDASRFFLMPSHPPGRQKGEYFVRGHNLNGVLLDWRTVERVSLPGRGRGTSGDAKRDKPRSYYCVQDRDGVTIDLKRWATKHGKDFDPESTLAAAAPDLVKTSRTSGEGCHIVCPHEAEHSTAGGLGTFCAPGDGTRGFTICCDHAHCQGRDRLDFMRELILQGHLVASDIGYETDDAQLAGPDATTPETEPDDDDDPFATVCSRGDFLELCVANLHEGELDRLAQRAAEAGCGAAFERDRAVASDVWRTITSLRVAGHKLRPTEYEILDSGVITTWHTVGRGKKAPRHQRHVCTPIILDAHGGRRDGSGWKLRVRVRAPDKTWSEVALERADLVPRGLWQRKLQDAGASITDAGAVLNLLLLASVPRELRVVDQTGWQDPGVWSEFVHGTELLTLDGTTQVDVEGGEDLTPQGSLDGWRQEVAALAVGNNTMAARILDGLAAPWKRPLDLRGGGHHLYRRSSRGKTTSGMAGFSVMGGPSAMKTWDASTAAFYALTRSRNDQVLWLDDTSLATKPENVKTITYAAGNGQEAARGTVTGGLRDSVPPFTIELMSDGEESIQVTLERAGLPYQQGQESRVPNIPFDEPENLHGEPDGAAFARRIEKNTREHHGWALRETVRHAMRPELREAVRTRMAELRGRFVSADHDGQVHRVAERFALAGAVGELSIQQGLLPWPSGYAAEVAERAFRKWIEARGGTESSDLIQGPRNLVSYYFRHRDSRFQDIGDSPDQFFVAHRTGYRRAARFRERTFEEVVIPSSEVAVLREIMGIADPLPVVRELERITLAAAAQCWDDETELPAVMLLTPRTSKALAGSPLSGAEKGLSWVRKGRKSYVFLVAGVPSACERACEQAHEMEAAHAAAFAERPPVSKSRR